MSNQENSGDPRCAELEGAIVGVADGSASADEAAAVTAHVARCAACAKELAETRELLGAVRASDVAAPVKTAGEWEAIAVATVAAARRAEGAGKNNGRQATGDRRQAIGRSGRSGSERPMGRLAVWTTLAAAAAIALFFGARAFMTGSGEQAPVIAHEEVVVPDVEIDDELIPELDELDEVELADAEQALEDEVEIDFADLEAPEVPADEALAELSQEQLAMVLEDLEQEKL